MFGEMSYVPGLTKELKTAIDSGAKKMENLVEFGSNTSLRVSFSKDYKFKKSLTSLIFDVEL